MINTQMRTYDYFLLDAANAYGQAQIPAIDSTKDGSIKMAINTSSQANQDNIKYKDATYVGLTLSAIDDTYIIKYNGARLKVLYINPIGKYKIVFMKEV